MRHDRQPETDPSEAVGSVAGTPPLADSITRQRSGARRWLRQAWGWLTTHRRSANAFGALTPAPDADVMARARSATRPETDSNSLPPGDVSAVSARSRVMLAELTRSGWNIGTAPYGYRLHTVNVIDPDGSVRRRSRLVADPVEAEVVRQLFTWRAAGGLTVEEILRLLRRYPRRYPPPAARLPSHSARWRAATVEGMLNNFKYTGYQVWNFRDGRGGVKAADQWVLSTQPVHYAVVSVALFWAAQNPTVASVRAYRHRLLAAEGRRRCG